MSKPIPPTKPTFVQHVSVVQKILAGITGSTFLMSLITMIPFVINLFKPDYLYLLSTLRVGFASASLICGCFVGIPQLWNMVGWLVKFYEYYKKFSELNKGKEEE